MWYRVACEGCRSVWLHSARRLQVECCHPFTNLIYPSAAGSARRSLPLTAQCSPERQHRSALWAGVSPLVPDKIIMAENSVSTVRDNAAYGRLMARQHKRPYQTQCHDAELTPSTPAVPNCCCSKGLAPYWSNPPFKIFDIRALWRSVLSARAPECQKF